MSTEFDWPRLAIETVGSLVSAFAGLLVGAWRWGRHSAMREQRMRDDYVARIEEMKRVMLAQERTAQDRLEELVEQFKEAFAGIRRQIDDDRLALEQNFVRKDDFREFREEFRGDMRDVKRLIAEIVVRNKS